MGENQSKCENNLGYYIKLDGDTGPERCVRNDGASKENLHFDNQS